MNENLHGYITCTMVQTLGENDFVERISFPRSTQLTSIVKHHRICCCIITAQGFPRVETQRGEIPALLGHNKVCDVLQWKYQRF